MYSDITGIILAGGKSTRMGENKSLLVLNGKTVIERVVELMRSIFKNVVIITNTPEEYHFLKTPLYKDIYEYKGPLAGIHSGLVNSKTEDNFIISCDIPLMNKNMIEYIVEFQTEKKITVCRADGYVQQLAGKYSQLILPAIEKSLKGYVNEIRELKQEKRKCAVLSLLDEMGAEIIDAKQLDFYTENLFYNMNRPEDYKFIIENLS